ncbi:hypothetical protein Syun_004171 [Stephania yunnanensis]|uniref:Uncharacterized protein n=1 Tax=Stephania yunnanensis TaxID=152371 RepID=A0AAP0Q2A5_9MAGN
MARTASSSSSSGGSNDVPAAQRTAAIADQRDAKELTSGGGSDNGCSDVGDDCSASGGGALPDRSILDETHNNTGQLGVTSTKLDDAMGCSRRGRKALLAQHMGLMRGLWLARAMEAHAPEYQSHYRHRHIRCEGLEIIRGKRELNGHGKEIKLIAYDLLRFHHMQHILRQLARDKVRVSVKRTERDKGLVRHRDKDMDNTFHLDRDFDVPVWECGQPGHFTSRWCVLCLEVSEEPTCSEGAQLAGLDRQGYGLGRVWPWAGQGRMWDPLVVIRIEIDAKLGQNKV